MKSILNKAGLFLLTFFLTGIAFAQDKKVDVDINVDKGGTQWYQQTWIWIAGGAVFILLLVALLRGSGSRKDA